MTTAIQTIDATVRLERRGAVIHFGNVSMTVLQAIEAAEAIYALAVPMPRTRLELGHCINCGREGGCTCDLDHGIDEARIRT